MAYTYKCHEAAEEEIAKLSKRLHAEYNKALREMKRKAKTLLAEQAEKDAKMAAKVDAGEMTAAQLKAWREERARRAGWYSDMVDQLAGDLARCDAQAAAIVNGRSPHVYAENANFGAFQVEKLTGTGTMWTLVDGDTVATLVRDRPDLLPQVTPKPDKTERWARRKITAAVTQSVLMGESVQDAAGRIAAVVEMDERAAVRAARTALTGAENAGRLSSYERARSMGIDVRAQWMATLDGRTRSSHRLLDGVVADGDGKFPNGLRYPGDPQGPAAEVWNCRCTLVPSMPSYDAFKGRGASKIGDDYDAWKYGVGGKPDEAKLADMAAEEALLRRKLAWLGAEKSYGGIWKDPVTLADWSEKQGKVQAKRDYFEAHRAEDPAKFDKLLADLDEFDRLGRKYADEAQPVLDRLEALKAQRTALRDAMVKSGKMKGPAIDAYSAERKAAALRAKKPREADSVLRSSAGRAWKAATEAEKDAVYYYTGSYNGINSPLNGYAAPYGEWYGQQYFKGVGKVWINSAGEGERIRKMTDYIERCELPEDVWLVRGVKGHTTLDNILGLPAGTVDSMTDDELKSLVGKGGEFGAFTSCGTMSGKGFGGDLRMTIYAPKGTHAAYAEPFSQFGNGAKRSWDGESGQKTFSSEFETIIQRGARFDVTSIKRSGGVIEVELEHHPERGYDLFQQDPDEWTGPKKRMA